MLKRLSIAVFIFIFMLTGVVFAASKININKATAQELEQLKGVGAKKAQRIIEYRDKNGPFQKPEDITLVQGIGPKLYEANKEMIAISDDAQAPAANQAAPQPQSKEQKAGETPAAPKAQAAPKN